MLSCRFYKSDVHGRDQTGDINWRAVSMEMAFKAMRPDDTRGHR